MRSFEESPGLRLSLAVAPALFLVAAGFAQAGKGKSGASGPVTFNRDIAPVVFRSCAPCHHSGEAGPFPLLTYGDVKSHARQIADVTQKRLMPPWLPSAEGLALEEELRLPEGIAGTFRPRRSIPPVGNLANPIWC
jgi:mono/diheme cytochrome c family protein